MVSIRRNARQLSLVVLSLAAATLIAGVAAQVAASHTTTYPTGIQITTAQSDGGHIIVSGYISAENRKCLPDRLIKLYAVELSGAGGDTLTLLDTDRTSREGAWAAMADDYPSGAQIRAVVTKKNIGRRDHNHLCGRAEETAA